MLFSKTVYASSCCGGSPAAFHLPKNNQFVSFNLNYSQINTVGRVFQENENFIEWTTKKRLLDVLGFSLSYMPTDRWSVGLQSSFLFSKYKDTFGTLKDQNWGDSIFTLNFEALPEYTYHRYKPKVFTSLIVNAPTGRSIFEEDVLPEGANVTGHKLWGLGLGLSLYKTWSPYQLNLQTRALHIFSGEINKQRISDYLDISSSLRFSRFLFKWAFVLGLDWSYISKKERSSFELISENLQALSSQKTASVFGINYVLNKGSTLSLTYSDETLLGQARNTLLNRTLSLNINQNFN